MEIDNVAGRSPLQEPLDAALLHAFQHEVRAALPRRLATAQADGIDNYLYTAKQVAVIETARRRARRARLPHLPPPVASR